MKGGNRYPAQIDSAEFFDTTIIEKILINILNLKKLWLGVQVGPSSKKISRLVGSPNNIHEYTAVVTVPPNH